MFTADFRFSLSLPPPSLASLPAQPLTPLLLELLILLAGAGEEQVVATVLAELWLGPRLLTGASSSSCSWVSSWLGR